MRTRLHYRLLRHAERDVVVDHGPVHCDAGVQVNRLDLDRAEGLFDVAADIPQKHAGGGDLHRGACDPRTDVGDHAMSRRDDEPVSDQRPGTPGLHLFPADDRKLVEDGVLLQGADGESQLVGVFVSTDHRVASHVGRWLAGRRTIAAACY